jgi:hypothetical protein
MEHQQQQHDCQGESKGEDTTSITTLGQVGEENDIELHECMAPLYYLYGTTLLYVVEESDVMMADNNGGGSDNNDGDNDKMQPQDEDGEEENEDEEKHGENDIDDHHEDDTGKSNKEDIKQSLTVSDPAVDLEIAWENLDLARSIIHRLVDIHNCEEEENNDNSSTTAINGGSGNKTIVYKSNDGSSNTNDSSSHPQLTLDQRNELLLDLAQVHVRLGDLQRQDDKSDSCIADYERALQLRKHVLGVFDKKVADCHFSLGQAYAEAPTRAQERDGRVNDFVQGLGGGGDSGDSGGGQDDAAAGSNSSSSSTTMTNERKAEYRRLSLEHYLACGHSFAGILASMCDTEYPYRESSIMDILSYKLSPVLQHAVVRDESKSMTTTDYTSSMSKLRKFVSTLVLPSSYLSSSHTQSVIEFNNIKEILDEIQEAMDSAEETECGLRSLSKMKANAKSGGGGTDEVGGGSSDGAVTTIGFGSTDPSLSVSVFGSTTTSTIGVGGTTSATATIMTTNGIATAAAVAAPPAMMIVKKKKKNLVTPHAVSTTEEMSTISGGGGGEDDLSSSKRHKTN